LQRISINGLLLSGGAFASTHASGTSQWYSPYVEGDQPEPQLNTRSMIIGGVRGAGTGFGQIYRDQGVLNLNGKTNITGNLGLNVANNANIIYPITLESTVNGTLAMFKTSGTAATIALQAAGGSNAYLWSQGGNLYYGVNGVQLQLNSTVFKDYVGNGVVDFGSAANQWKDVYAKRFFRDGVELTGAGGGISQQTLNDTAAAIRAAIPSVPATVTRVFLPNDVINNNGSANTLADLTGLTFPVVAGNTYAFKVVVVYSSAATTTGSRWVINGPAATHMSYTSQYPTSATAITNNTSLAGYNLPAASNASE